MNIKNFQEAHKVLERYVPPARSEREAYTLDRIQKLMSFLGDPQNAYKVIHVAGTSGKTSTCYYIAGFLKASGHKVGLTVSPHVDEINERIQINLEPLDEKTYCKQLSKFLEIIESSNIKPTYFELLVAFAYWQFAESKVEYAVVEVGLGGLLDGTNVIDSKNKVCVITDIGLDHTNVLGRTIPEIAAQKAGIIRPYNPVFIYVQDEAVMEVVREVSRQQQAELHELLPLRPSELPAELPLFQRRNWYLAYSVYEFLAVRDGLPQLDEAHLAETTDVHIPARMEIIRTKTKTIILDGAHNAQKMQTLAASIRQMFPGQEIATLLSIVHSKNFKVRTSLEQITAISHHVIITSFKTQQDLRKESVPPEKVAEHCWDLGFEDFSIIHDPKKAYEQLLKRPEPVLLVTGSFYLLNHIRPLVKNKKRP